MNPETETSALRNPNACPFTMGKNFYPGWEFEISVTESSSDSNVSHHCYRIIYVSEGSALLSNDIRSHSVIAPACLTLNEKELFMVSDVSDLRYTMICFHPRMVNSELSYDNVVDANPHQSATIKMDRCSLRPFIERDEGFTGYFQLGIESELRLKQFIINLEHELRTQDTDLWPCRSRSTLFEILFLLGNAYRGGIPVPHNADVTDSTVQRIIRFFGNNYHRKIMIKEICERFQTNRNTLAGAFYHETGKTVIEYLNDLRISIACMMLRDTELVIEEIGYRTGFNDPAHFRRTFRKKTGLSPALYRRTFFRK